MEQGARISGGKVEAPYSFEFELVCSPKSTQLCKEHPRDSGLKTLDPTVHEQLSSFGSTQNNAGPMHSEEGVSKDPAKPHLIFGGGRQQMHMEDQRLGPHYGSHTLFI